jgi:hypothetical protein
VTAGLVGVAAGLVGVAAGLVGVGAGLVGAGVTAGLTGVGAGLVGAGTGFTGAGAGLTGAGAGFVGVGAGLVGAGAGLVGAGAGAGVAGAPMGRGLAGTTGLGFVVWANASAPNTTRPASKPRATTFLWVLELAVVRLRLRVGNNVLIRAAKLRRRALARFIVSPRRLYGLFQNLETHRAEFLRSQYRGQLALDLAAGR